MTHADRHLLEEEYPMQVQFIANLQWVVEQSVAVNRLNFGQEPAAIAAILA